MYLSSSTCFSSLFSFTVGEPYSEDGVHHIEYTRIASFPGHSHYPVLISLCFYLAYYKSDQKLDQDNWTTHVQHKDTCTCTKPYQVSRQLVRSYKYRCQRTTCCSLSKAITSLGVVPVVETRSTRIHTFTIRVATLVVSIHVLVLIRHDQGTQPWQELTISLFSARSTLAALSHLRHAITLCPTRPTLHSKRGEIKSIPLELVTVGLAEQRGHLNCWSRLK